MKSAIESNKQDIKAKNQDSDEKMMKLTEDFKPMLASYITSIIDQINTLKYYLTQKD